MLHIFHGIYEIEIQSHVCNMHKELCIYNVAKILYYLAFQLGS